MNRKVLLSCTMREDSTRCESKMTKPFADTTIADINLKKLEELKKDNKCFDNIIVAICPKDKKLYEKAHNYGVKLVDRSEHSVTKATKVNDINEHLNDFNQSHILWLNASAPFVTLDNLKIMANVFLRNYEYDGIHLVKNNRNWFWKDNEIINVVDTSLTRLQECEPFLESIHSHYLYNREYMLETGSYWKFEVNNPYLYIVEEAIDYMDVDTQFDFKLCEHIYESLNSG